VQKFLSHRFYPAAVSPACRESRVGDNLRWAQSNLGKSKALKNASRGVWALIAKGRRLKESDSKEVVAAVRSQQSGRSSPVAAVRKTSIMRRQPGHGTVEAELVQDRAVGWKNDLIGVMQGVTAKGFERLCQRILRESAFLKVEVTGRSGHGGIDGVGVQRVALLSFQVCFQCKKWKGKVPAKDIRDFRGAMVGRTDKGCSCPPASPSQHGESAGDFLNSRMHQLCPVRSEVGHPRRAVNQFLVWAWRRRETTSGKRRRGAHPAPQPPCQLQSNIEWTQLLAPTPISLKSPPAIRQAKERLSSRTRSADFREISRKRMPQSFT